MATGNKGNPDKIKTKRPKKKGKRPKLDQFPDRKNTYGHTPCLSPISPMSI